MSRQEIPNRRPCVNRSVPFTFTDNGLTVHLQVTFGFNDKEGMRRGEVREVFCASFKAGTQMNSTVMDGCILMSLLLQHGMTADDLASRMYRPPTVMGAIAQAAAKVSREERERDDGSEKAEVPKPKESGGGANVETISSRRETIQVGSHDGSVVPRHER